ncbi:MAG TPA: hypothetical protein EYN06_02045 [Myxococcales bacterium]|nr:hypothetical protein [Myxococcales bacterium]HIN85233.1 hypothetical protein [Myxococcales bacterium]
MARHAGALFSVFILFLGCGGSGDSSDGSGTSGGGSTTGEQSGGPLSVSTAGAEIGNNGSYCTPLNACHEDNVVSLFSEQRTLMTITNNTSSDMSIDSVYVTRHAKNMAEEWTLIDTELVPSPLSVDGSTLPPGGIIDFYPRFFPVQSGPRSCTITVKYNGTKEYSFVLTGYGSYDSMLASYDEPSLERLLGGMDSDELTGGMVVTNDGGIVYAANVTQLVDTFSTDILVAKTSSTGDLSWAKVWNGPYEDKQPDPGQNSESGGGADSIATDGNYAYLVGRVSPTNSNSTYYSLLLKVDTTDGSMAWEKAWSPKGKLSVASDSSQFYGVDVDGDTVYVTGTNLGEAEVSLVAFDPSGNVKAANSFDLHAGSNDRGYTVRSAGNDTVYIGGNGSGDAILMKVSQASTNAPNVEWASRPALGTGGNINSMDVDSDGNLYVAFDMRGAATHYVFGKITSDGNVEWAQEYMGTNGDNNNIHVVRFIDGKVVTGGRIGPSLLDAQMGDGCMTGASSDGGNLWAMEYFTGKGPDEMTEHRVKGLALTGNGITHIMQSYGGTANYDRYWGYWYVGSGQFGAVTITPASRNATVSALPGNAAEDASGMRTSYSDAPSTLRYMSPKEYKGQAPDANIMVMQIAP